MTANPELEKLPSIDYLLARIHETDLRMLELACSIYRARVEGKEEVQPRRA